MITVIPDKTKPQVISYLRLRGNGSRDSGSEVGTNSNTIFKKVTYPVTPLHKSILCARHGNSGGVDNTMPFGQRERQGKVLNTASPSSQPLRAGKTAVNASHKQGRPGQVGKLALIKAVKGYKDLILAGGKQPPSLDGLWNELLCLYDESREVRENWCSEEP